MKVFTGLTLVIILQSMYEYVNLHYVYCLSYVNSEKQVKVFKHKPGFLDVHSKQKVTLTLLINLY